MRHSLLMVVAVGFFGIPVWMSSARGAEKAAGGGPAAIQAGNSLHSLHMLRDARTRRVSSSDPNWRDGNVDARPVKKGETLELANISGAGVIRHIWFTIYGGGPKFPRALVLRMYWDGNPEPAVESPLGDFFAVGHGATRLVNSLPVSITSEAKAYNCYWPMPFAKSARLTITNDGPEDAGVYFYIDYEELASLQPGTAYFHAQYRQEYPCVMGRNYLILDAVGRGHYVGTVQSCQFRTASWYGEGDDFFFVDGEEEPSLRGTGTEDYFCDGWGFRLADRPFYGCTLLDGYEVGDRVTVYRWHIPDPVHFKKSLRVEIEHKGVMFDTNGKLVSGFMEREDLMSTVAFWYQTGKAKRFATVPPYDERVLPQAVIEFEASLAAAKERVKPADTPMTVQDVGACSGGKQLFVQFASADGVVTIPFTLKEAVQGIGRLQLVKSWDYGVFRVSLDGKVLRGMEAADLCSSAILVHTFNLGPLDLAAGEHELKVECVGKNGYSRGFFVGVDSLNIERITPYLVPPKAEEKK